MAITYQRNTWETGKVITAKALNDIETGIVNIVETLNGMDGEVTSQTLTARGDANIGGDAAITGNATFSGSVEINGTTTLKGATIINGATAINNNVTVSANQHIILLEGASESPNESNYVVTKGYVDGEVTTINGRSINSTNTGIAVNGTLGSGISIELKPASTTALGGIKVGDKLSFTDNILNLPIASTSVLGGIKVGDNLTINETTGELSGNYSVATASAAGLMSSSHFDKLENNVVTGISINGGTAQSPTNGVVNINVLTQHQDISSKANLDSPKFSGMVNFGDQISIDTNDNKITINQTDITEQKINALYNLPSIPPLSSEDDDGTYILQASKTTPEGAAEPVITYSWVPVPEQESGGEGS